MTEILFQPLGNPLAASRPMEKIADIDSRLTRTHYFDGRLLTAEDLERDQVYLDERLREAGKILGEGVAQGLELSFDRYSGVLTLTAGFGITRLGRIVQLDTSLTVNVTDSALISQMNKGRYRHFNRGLYAVVLNYVEVATDLAEVFPTDLASKRGSDYAAVTEGVQLGLVPLPIALTQQDELRARASLQRTLQDNELADSMIPGDSLPLGVLAIRNDAPQWLDSDLLRHPPRREATSFNSLEDLYRQYNALFADVMSHRHSGAMSLDFAASDYFSLMPAAGRMPKAAVDAERGVQSFFPDHYNVHIAPVRMAEAELLLEESLPLPAIDLSSKEIADIMILVPLSNYNYGRLAAQLERRNDVPERRLKAIDPLRLSIYPRPAPHEIDTDADVWREIFNANDNEAVLYVRRPVRAAETIVSGIVLANGFDLPPDPDPVSDPVNNSPTDSVVDAEPVPVDVVSPVDSGGTVVDEGKIFLNFFNLYSASEFRSPKSDPELEAFKMLAEKFGKDAETTQDFMWLLMRISPWFDPILWRTLAHLTRNGMLKELSSMLFENENGHPNMTGKIIYKLLDNTGAEGELLDEVKKLVEMIPA
ncbi:MAG: hypothetical protein VW258_03580 [Thalassolituus sp.]